MNTATTTQGFEKSCPWGVSHRTRLTPTKQLIEGRIGFIVETQYYLRVKLPKYVRKLYKNGDISAERMKEVFRLFQAHFNGIEKNITFIAVSALFHDSEGEITVKMIVNDEQYNRDRLKQLYARFKSMLDEILDYFRDVLIQKYHEFAPRHYLGYYIADGKIRFSRSP